MNNSSFIEINIKSGTLTVPRDWFLLNPEEATSSEYAWVLDYYLNGSRLVSPIVYFSNEVDAEMIESQRDFIIERCRAAYPDHRNVFSAYTINFYLIRDENDPQLPCNYKHPYGAMIKRN